MTTENNAAPGGLTLLQEPTRPEYDADAVRFGACDHCGKRSHVRPHDGAKICGNCADAEYLSQWKDYASQLRALLAAGPKQAVDWRYRLIGELGCPEDLSDDAIIERVAVLVQHSKSAPKAAERAPVDAARGEPIYQVHFSHGWLDVDAADYASLSGDKRIVYSAPAQQAAPLTDAARDVLAERRRQVEVEGWTPAHDDEHSNGEMAVAAAAYASESRTSHGGMPGFWPWAREWWKPGTARRMLVKAGALILAEIERIDRAALQSQGEAR